MSDATLTITPPVERESAINPRVEVDGHDPSKLISMRNIWKTYQMGTESVHALHGVSFDIPRGEYIAIIGPSGSGKSTLMNLIGCLDTPSQGQYWLNGKNVSEMDDDELARIRNQEVGFVFQTFNLMPRLSVEENVALPLKYRGGVARADRRARALTLLERLGLGHRIGHRPDELSGGERQRVAIARALVGAPAILMADEPTGNLDSTAGNEVMKTFAELHSSGHTIVLVTHDPGVAARAGRVIQMSDGRVV
mgnify:CR=1 FL=1